MSEYSAAATLTPAVGSPLSFNGSAVYVLTNVTGLDQAPIRAPIDDKPQTDGGLLHNFFKGPRHVTIEGYIVPVAVATRNGYMSNLIVALDTMLRADGTWAWTPTGESAHTLTVRCDVPCEFTGNFVKKFVFGLVAANPNWS